MGWAWGTMVVNYCSSPLVLATRTTSSEKLPKRGITVKSVQVDVDGDWGADPVRAQNVTFSTNVEAEAEEKEIMELIQHTDRVAEIHNSLRMGTQVTLTDAKAFKVKK